MTYYWKPVKNGLSIMALLQKQNSSSQGYILYDAELTNFNKYIIAYSINQTNLTFYYCLPKIDVEKMNLTLLIK